MKEILKKVKPHYLFLSVGVVAAFLFWSQLSVKDGCVLSSVRPCYDKASGKRFYILKTNAGQNAFEACKTNSAFSDNGTSSIKTSFCDDENFSYCYEGKSKNFLRKFDGSCNVIAPVPIPIPVVTPPSTPVPTPTPTPTPILTPTPTPTPTLLVSSTPTPANLDVINISGRFIDTFSKKPIANVAIRIGTSSTGLPIFIYSNSNGEFYFSTITTDVTQTKPKPFPFSINCYLQLGHVAAIFRNPDNSLYLASFLFDLKGGDRFINPLTTSDVNLGDVPLWPAKSITVNSDIPIQLYIGYPEEGRSVGNSLFKTQHILSNVVPLEYDTVVRLTDSSGNVYYSPSHRYTLQDGCAQSILNFNSGQFNWQ